MGMAEPRRVAFISLSPVRRREAEYPGAEREPEYPREPPRLEPQPHREPARAEQPAPREAAPRPDAQPPPREKPLAQREVSRAEPPMSLQREPPRPEPPPPPPLPLPQLHLQPPPPRESASRAEPQQRPPRETVRLELVLKDPTEESCVEFSYPELLLFGEQRVQKVPPSSPRPPGASGPVRLPLWFAPSDAHPARGRPEWWAGGGQGLRAVSWTGRVVGAAFLCSPGLAEAPREPSPKAAPSRFSSASFESSDSPPFCSPHKIMGPWQVVWLCFPCGAPAVLSSRKEEKTLGDTPPNLKQGNCVTPPVLSSSSSLICYAWRCGYRDALASVGHIS